MEKAQLPLFDNEELGLSDNRHSNLNPFLGTTNPRHLRVIDALLKGSLSREQVDRVAGCSNGPQLIDDLQGKNLEIPCTMRDGIDRDGKKVRHGVYELTELDRQKILDWQQLRGQLCANG